MEKQGKWIVFVGICIVVVGLLVWLLGDKLRFLGRLPGDIRIDRGNVKVFIPLTTMLLVSVLLSVVFWLLQRLGK